jgi:hypothetical protein
MPVFDPDADAELVAQKWYDLHAKHNNLTERFYDDPLVEDRIGVKGEIAFGEKYNLMRYWLGREDKPYGDGGIDFDVPGLGTLGIKTAQKPYYLLEKSGKATAHYYILGQYIDDPQVVFIGWAFGPDLAKAPIKDIGGKGILSHYIHQSKLRPMHEIVELIEGALKNSIPLCEKLNDPKYDRIKAMSWPEYSADLVERQRAELTGRKHD